MSLGIKLLWRIRPQLVVTSPAFARRPPTLPHPVLPELLLPSPWQSRCHGGSIRHASNSTTPRRDASHDTQPPPVPRSSDPRRVFRYDETAAPTIQKLESLLRNGPDFAVADKDGNTDVSTTRVPVPADSVMDKLVNRYPQHRETMSSYSRHMRKKDAMLRVEERHAQHGRVPDWRVVLSMLRKNTLRATWSTPDNAKIIWVPETVVDTLLHEPDHNIWDIAQRTECVLELSTDEVEVDAAGRRLVRLRLSGSDQALNAARTEISALSFEQPPTPVSAPESDGRISAISMTTEAAQWSSNRPKERPSAISNYKCKIPYEDIPRPEKWTTRSLEAWIFKIVRAKLGSQIMSAIYGVGVDGRMEGLALMQRVLASEEAAAALSVQAFKLALYFAMYIGPGCRPQARALISTATAARLPLDTSVFDILLAGNAHAHDLESFAAVLRIMGKRGLAPSFASWAHFLSMIEDLRVKMHVCRAMDDHGLLRGLHGRRALAYEFVLYELEQERGRWSGVQAFFDRQEKKFGPGWLTQETSNRVIDELGRQGKFKSCIEFFDVVNPQGLTDVTTLNILLNHATQQRSTVLAIIALQRAQINGIKPDKDSYHELFKLFRSLRKPNCMSVVWRTACLEDLTTFRMRRSITDLYNNYPAILNRDAVPPDPVSHPTGRPDSQYHLWRDIPTFHHPSMETALLRRMEAMKSETWKTVDKSSSWSEPPGSIGPFIAQLYRSSWDHRMWRMQRPLYALLTEADAADRELELRGKERRERAQLEAISAGSSDALSEVTTDSNRVASEGVPFLIEAKSHRSGITTLVDLKPTIYSRTYGIAEAEADMSGTDDVTKAEQGIPEPADVPEVKRDTPGSDDTPSEKA